MSFISREEINNWPIQKNHQVMRNIFEAAKRDLSVNDGECIPESEVNECLSVMNMIEKDMDAFMNKLNAGR